MPNQEPNLRREAMERTQILEEIGKMTVLELSQLIKDMEEKFGVSAAAAGAGAGARPGRAAAAAAGEEDPVNPLAGPPWRHERHTNQDLAPRAEPGPLG